MAIEFSVDHNDTIADDNGIEPLIGWVTATVETRSGNYRVRDLGGPTPRALKIEPRRGWLAADGHMYKDGTLAAPFRLVANDPAFNLRELTYRFDFDLTTLVGVPVSIPFCRGPAPGTDTTLYLARLMNDLDQPVIEVRTKGYIEDILNAGTIGQQIVVANTGEAAREAAYAASDDDFRLSDTRIPTDGSVTPAKLTAALSAVQELIGYLHSLSAPNKVLRVGHGTVDADQVEVWAAAARVLFWNSTGAFLLGNMVVGADADAASRSISLNSATQQGRSLRFQTASVDRWVLFMDTGTESSTATGGDLSILARNNDGTAHLTVVQFKRDTGVATFGALVATIASATGSAGFRLPHGAAPTSPVNGDVWTTTAGLFARINGTTEQLASTADIATAVANLVNSSPATLDTLKELADALGDDPNFAATTATALGLRVLISAPVLNALPTGSGVSSTATASTLAARDANANLAADVFAPGETSTATAAGTTTLTVDSTTVQRFTGTTTQSVLLPTTNVTAGWSIIVFNDSTGTVTVKSSDGTTLVQVAAGKSGFFWARQDTPTGSGHWGWTVPDSGGSRGGTTVIRDTNTNIFAGGYFVPANTVATAAGTTTLTLASGSVTVFTGSTTQTVKLPTTTVTPGMEFTIINQSSGAITVQSSGGNAIGSAIPGGANIAAKYMALVNTPTAAADWQKTL